MRSRALLARRLHRSVDSVDRALRELVSAGIVHVQRRRHGRQFLSNRYYVRTTPLSAASSELDGSRTSAATPVTQGGGRKDAATPGRTSAATVAADVRPYPESLTHRPPPPGCSPAGPAPHATTSAVEAAHQDLLRACGIADIDDLSRPCMAARSALGQPSTRWTPQFLSLAIRMAVVNRGWPADQVQTALLGVAADRRTRSPVRVAEAGPWWDSPTNTNGALDDDLPALEQRLAELDGRRPALKARAELTEEGLPLTRGTVTRGAVQILDRYEEPA
jgi:hypothetical protein